MLLLCLSIFNFPCSKTTVDGHMGAYTQSHSATFTHSRILKKQARPSRNMAKTVFTLWNGTLDQQVTPCGRTWPNQNLLEDNYTVHTQVSWFLAWRALPSNTTISWWIVDKSAHYKCHTTHCTDRFHLWPSMLIDIISSSAAMMLSSWKYLLVAKQSMALASGRVGQPVANKRQSAKPHPMGGPAHQCLNA